MIDEYIILIRVSQASVLLPFFLGVAKYKRLGSFQRLLWKMQALSVLTECVAMSVSYFSSAPDNLWVYNVFAILLMAVTNRLYAQLLPVRWLRPFWNAPLLGLLVLAGINAFVLQPFHTFQSYFIAASFAVNILFAFMHFLQLLKGSVDLSFTTEPGFWFRSGMFIYNSSTLLFFLFINEHLPHSKAVIFSPWGLNALMYIILNLLYLLALWMPSK